MRKIALFLLFTASWTAGSVSGETIRVGGKNFNEGYVLAEICAQALENSGFEVERVFGLGGTLVCYEALRNGEIDLYPEYSGTISQAILKLEHEPSYEELRQLLEEQDLRLLESFGFNNTYAIALLRERADSLGLRTIGDLARHEGLRLGFSHEFINRNDGWPGLAETYSLPMVPSGIEHGLAYQAIAEGKIDVTDVYSTDGDIRKYNLAILRDDRDYFPEYLAGALTAADLPERARAALARLAGTIDAETMQRLNGEVLLAQKSFAEVAAGFLETIGARSESMVRERQTSNRWPSLVRRTVRHLQLTFLSLVLGIAVAVPLGVLVYRLPAVAKPVLYVAGLLQTIPSIALLAFMIPLFGVGLVPALVALFLYALLPILRNTATALFAIDPVLKRVATGMGLTRGERLRHVELPLAAPLILAGIKTAAIINIGTATLAAFIGAGGLGEPIVTGLALNDSRLILEGAVPAALLAILIEFLFEGIERLTVPRHLLTKEAA